LQLRERGWSFRRIARKLGVLRDAVGCTLIRLEFVIPDAYDEAWWKDGLPAAEAGAVPTDFVGVSDPRLTVTLDEVSSSRPALLTRSGRGRGISWTERGRASRSTARPSDSLRVPSATILVFRQSRTRKLPQAYP